MSNFSHIIAPIITTMNVAPSPHLPTTLLPTKFKMLGPPQYYQKIIHKFDLATYLIFKFLCLVSLIYLYYHLDLGEKSKYKH